MPYYVGLDASKYTTQICVLDAQGEIVKEVSVPTDQKAIIAALRGEGRHYRRIGIEVWSMSSWLYEGLVKAGLPAICIEAFQASQILKGRRRNKTDKNDARGIAELMRTGLYRTVHVKTEEGQRLRTMLTIRRFLKAKLVDTENLIRSILLSKGIKLPSGKSYTFERRVQITLNKTVEYQEIIGPLLNVRRSILDEAREHEERVVRFAEEDPVCRRLMTAPCIGPITAVIYRAAIDEPRRFQHSRDVGPHLGLTPATRQSGKRERRGRISCCGDSAARAALYMAAMNQARLGCPTSWLKDWGAQIGARRGRGKAHAAVARRLAVVLHRMWITETDFCWTTPP